VQSSLALFDRIFDYLDRPIDIVEGTHELESPRGDVAFEDVCFRYDEDAWTLKDVSFTVPAGTKTALVGETGSGKTTCGYLVARLYDATQGRVTIDGADVRDLTQASLRSQLAIVTQETFLFHDTVRANIAYGAAERYTSAQIEAAARAAHAHGFISALPEGYQTNLHERGANFSGGQRQLLSFARALAHGADVLVLDEATSSIDTETEALIQQALRVLWKGKTALVIAHRLSTIQDVDRIHVLHHGRIVESGRHEELLARRGVYHRLYRLQYETQKAVAGPPATGGKG
jgi:ATP-binding cassette subfamily B protein